MTLNLVFSLSSAVFGSAFQFGYNTGVINAPGELIKAFINETHYDRYGNAMDPGTISILFGIIVAIFALGGMAGGLFNGFFADRLGRKKSLLINNVFAIVGALLMGFSKLAKSYEMIMLGRLFVGLNCGFNSGLCPMYITELAPVNIRGAVGTLFQLGAVFSIFLSQVLGLPEIFGTKELWPLLLAFTGLFALFQLATLPFCPESPRFLLIQKNRLEETTKTLKALRQKEDVADEIDAMNQEAQSEKNSPKFNFCELFHNKALLFPTIVAIVLHLSQQLSGINAIFYYSETILKNAGVQNAKYTTPFVGLILVFTTLISIPLMEVKGRRFLHLLGLVGMFVFSVVMTISTVLKYDWIKYLNVIGMMCYIFFFAIGPGSIPWMVVGEFFTQGPRSVVISIAVFVNWSANIAVGQLFPILFDSVTKDWTFSLFSGLLLIFIVFVYAFMPETKGRTAEEMANYFKFNRLAFKQPKDNRVDSDKSKEAEAAKMPEISEF